VQREALVVKIYRLGSVLGLASIRSRLGVLAFPLARS